VRSTVAQAYYLNGDFEIAAREWQAVSDLAPEDPSYHYYVAWSLEQLGQLDRAIEIHEKAVELSGRAHLYVGGLGYSLARAGREDEAIVLLDELLGRESESGFSAFNVAIVNLGLGRSDEALDWLEKSLVSRDSHMLYIKQAAQFDPLRGEPRFEKLLKEMGW
jgi:serine/threonine-protein kinase